MNFQYPKDMHLRENNRWVKKAQTISRDRIAAKCASFPSDNGYAAKPLQLALGACLIQRELKLNKFLYFYRCSFFVLSAQFSVE